MAGHERPCGSRAPAAILMRDRNQCGDRCAGILEQILSLKSNTDGINQPLLLAGHKPMPRPDVPTHLIHRIAPIGIATLIAWSAHAQPAPTGQPPPNAISVE